MVSEALHSAFLNHAKVITYSRQQVVSGGQGNRFLHYVEDGMLAVEMYIQAGETVKTAMMGLRPTGSLLGAELIFSDKGDGGSSCVAVTKSRVASIPVTQLKKLLDGPLAPHKQEVMESLQSEVAESLVQMKQRIIELSTTSAETRVLRSLMHLALHTGRKMDGKWEIEVSNEMMMTVAFVSRETLRAVYSGMTSKHHMLRAGRGKIVVFEDAFKQVA